MINSIRLQNVQGHADTYLEFDPGVNVFIGSTDAGKSTIIRALHWAVRDGNAISPKNEQNKTVTIVVDGRKISKSRQGRKYQYQIDDGSYFSGKAIPEEITKICDFTDINFQNQFDPPFMVMDTGIERSKTINGLIDLRGMDICKSETNIEATNKQREIAFLVEKIGEETTKIKKMDDILQMSNYLSALEKHGRQLEDNLSAIDKINDLCFAINEVHLTAEKFKHLSGIDLKVNRLLEDVGILQKNTRRVNKLVDLCHALHAVYSEAAKFGHIDDVELEVNKLLAKVNTLHSTNRVIDSLCCCVTGLKDVQAKKSNIDIVVVEHNTDELIQLCLRCVHNTNVAQSMQSIVEKLNHIRLERNVSARKLKSLQNQFILPEICPLCGQDIDQGVHDVFH